MLISLWRLNLWIAFLLVNYIHFLIFLFLNLVQKKTMYNENNLNSFNLNPNDFNFKNLNATHSKMMSRNLSSQISSKKEMEFYNFKPGSSRPSQSSIKQICIFRNLIFLVKTQLRSKLNQFDKQKECLSLSNQNAKQNLASLRL